MPTTKKPYAPKSRMFKKLGNDTDFRLEYENGSVQITETDGNGVYMTATMLMGEHLWCQEELYFNSRDAKTGWIIDRRFAGRHASKGHTLERNKALPLGVAVRIAE